MPWERPKNIPFPTVWHRFTGKVKINGKPLEYRIQDVTEDLIEPCIDQYVRHYLIREALTSHEGFVEKESELKIIKDAWRNKFQERCSLVAIVEGEGDESKRIAGVNCLFVAHRDDPKDEFESDSMMKIIKEIEKLVEKENLFDKFGVDRYLTTYGLSVPAHHQGDSVALNLMKARYPLCEAFDLSLVVAGFSNPAGLHEALKDGYKIINETPVNEITNIFPRLKNTKLVLTAKSIPSSK